PRRRFPRTSKNSASSRGLTRDHRHLNLKVRRIGARLQSDFLRAFSTTHELPDACAPSVLRRDPGPVHPRRIVPNVPGVATGQIGDPVARLVLVESDDGLPDLDAV